jgi:hypothetical protein
VALGKRRSSTISCEALATFVIGGFDPHCSLQIEPVDLGRERPPALRLEAAIVAVIRTKGRLCVEPHQRAHAKRHVRASVDRIPLGRLVREVLGRAWVDEAMLAQPAHGTVTYTADDALQRTLRRCAGVVKARCGVLGAREYAVQHDGMEVEVQVQAAAEVPSKLRRRALPDGRR